MRNPRIGSADHHRRAGQQDSRTAMRPANLAARPGSFRGTRAYSLIEREALKGATTPTATRRVSCAPRRTSRATGVIGAGAPALGTLKRSLQVPLRGACRSRATRAEPPRPKATWTALDQRTLPPLAPRVRLDGVRLSPISGCQQPCHQAEPVDATMASRQSAPRPAHSHGMGPGAPEPRAAADDQITKHVGGLGAQGAQP